MEERLGALVAAHAGYAYSTRSGWRWVVALAAPALIHTAEDWNAWRSRYAAVSVWLQREHGLTADPACSEPGCLHRLPCAVRDDVRQVPTVIGTVERLGAFELPEAPSVGIATRPPLAVSSEPSQCEPLGVDVSEQQARSPLYRKLAAAGLILGQSEAAGSFRVLCPRRRLHSTGRDGDGSTTLFLAEGNGYGVLHCFHSACSGMTTPQWLDALDDGTAQPTRRVVRIEGVGIDQARDGVCLSMRVSAADGGAELPLRYLKVYSSTGARWRALFEGAGVEPPEDLQIGGDLSAACAELRGRLLTLQLEDSVVRMILPAQERAA